LELLKNQPLIITNLQKPVELKPIIFATIKNEIKPFFSSFNLFVKNQYDVASSEKNCFQTFLKDFRGLKIPS